MEGTALTILLASLFTTWWFYLAVIIIAFLLIRLRIRTLAARENKLRATIRRKTEELRTETHRAQRGEKIKEQFLANMSHEIRTPMNAILGMTNLLLESSPREDQLRYLSAIKQSSANLLTIINDILDFSRIEAGKMLLENISFDLGKIMNGLYDTLQFKASEKGLAWQIDIDEQVPQLLQGDPVRLNQVLLNLAGNAIKFTERGSVKILVKLTGLEGKKATLRFEVSDTGIGINEEQQKRIFESFTQAAAETSRKFGGTGLGLAISKRLVEMQDGTMGLESEWQKGSTFWFNLPFTIATSEHDEPNQEKDQLTAPSGLSILLAEDNPFNQMVAVDTLEKHLDKVNVQVVENGKLAVEALREGHYDLVLMDVQMPEMDGHEASQLIRKEEENSGKAAIPIIALTANAMPSEIERCKASGMNDFVPKPYEIKTLISKIAAHTTSLASQASEKTPPPAE